MTLYRGKYQNSSPLLPLCINNKTIFTSRLDLHFRKKKFHIWSITLYGDETWKLRKAYQKYLEIFEMKYDRDSRRKGIS